MAKKRPMWVLFGILVISAWVLGSATPAGAETMKGRTATINTKDESIPVSDEERHSLHLIISEGLAFFENGEIAKVRAHTLNDRTRKGGQSIGYTIYTFEDGSTIVQRFQRLLVSGSGEVTSELIKGTGRYQGMKGTASGTSKSFRAGWGEAARNTSDLTFTYTLPTK